MKSVRTKHPNRAVGLAISLWLALGGGTLAQKPNVILIVTDDQGYGDLACHGNPVIQTPNLDRLHAESVRLTNFHVDPTCSPTRGALMSGKYSHRAKVWHTICAGNHLRASEMTMADAFKASGYRTAMFGKWHLGSNYPYRPMDRGFDQWLGQGDGGTGTTDDFFTNDRVNDMYWHNGQREYREGYASDIFFNAAIDFVKQQDREQPFFTYVCTYMPHHPHILPDPGWAKKYEGKVGKGVAFFFAGIERIDRNLGLLRKALQETGQTENTLLMFMTDNGGTTGVKLFNAGMRGQKGDVYDGGHRVPFFIHWPAGGLRHGADVADLNAHIDVLPTLVDICGLTPPRATDFDGRSFKAQLFEPEKDLPARTLFVERQRTIQPEKWAAAAAMTRRWRLIDGRDLYDMEADPGQQTNVADQHPEVVGELRKAFDAYWDRVTPGDRDRVTFAVGHPADPETFLHPSDWHASSVPWNHDAVARGVRLAGSWMIRAAEKGIYRFEVRRWPKEADAPLSGIPKADKTVDAWEASGGKTTLLYAGPKSPFKALPVAAVRLRAGGFDAVKNVDDSATCAVFAVPLEAAEYEVRAELLDAGGDVIAGGYYVYCTRRD